MYSSHASGSTTRVRTTAVAERSIFACISLAMASDTSPVQGQDVVHVAFEGLRPQMAIRGRV